MGGYGPPSTTFSRALKFIGDRLGAQFGDRVDIKYVWNIMDLGFRGEDIWWLVEHGLLSLGYQSSSALTDRIPALGVADLPFLFATNEEARAAVDGPLGAFMTRLIEAGVNYRILGYFENGFRHISNRLRPIRQPSDLAGMRIRTLNSKIQERTFALLEATPVRSGLKEAIQAMAENRVDAQENPLANTVTYGAHTFHHFHTLTRHFYISRPIFLNRTAFEAWPQDLQDAMRQAVIDAIPLQRALAVEEEELSRRAIVAQGCEIEELSASARAAFRAATAQVYEEARADIGEEAVALLKTLGKLP
ncbi:MAG: TRAP transporter substrate-binding protein [Variibacter sp.]|nr:TRAP transporter substrate-binding protein [Variibacter sp.]